jgi:hypothetical protein
MTTYSSSSHHLHSTLTATVFLVMSFLVSGELRVVREKDLSCDIRTTQQIDADAKNFTRLLHSHILTFSILRYHNFSQTLGDRTSRDLSFLQLPGLGIQSSSSVSIASQEGKKSTLINGIRRKRNFGGMNRDNDQPINTLTSLASMLM